MAAQPQYGPIEGVEVGATFESRQAVAAAGIHRPLQAGIAGTGRGGAESVVVSGGYEDDEDHGDVIIYTGHGGNDPATVRQIADQSFDASGNAALVTSSLTGAPVRVVRGRNRHSSFAPATGYRYDGLFRVESWWTELGKSGYAVCRYRLIAAVAESVAADNSTMPAPAPAGTASPGRGQAVVQRVVRSSRVVEFVKQAHDHTCQICHIRLSIRGRGYSEGAHIRPLGRPHDGPDVPGNVLCLCANCHVLFDNGAITIADGLVARTPTDEVPLRTAPQHDLDLAQLAYHRGIHG